MHAALCVSTSCCGLRRVVSSLVHMPAVHAGMHRYAGLLDVRRVTQQRSVACASTGGEPAEDEEDDELADESAQTDESALREEEDQRSQYFKDGQKKQQWKAFAKET